MYNSLKANLSKKQLLDLHNGKAINITYANIGKGKTFTIESENVQPYKNGIKLQMSREMIVKNGGSLFGSILKGLAKVAVAGTTTGLTGNPLAGAAAGAVSSPFIDYTGDKLGLGLSYSMSGNGVPSRGRDFGVNYGSGISSVVDRTTKMANDANNKIAHIGDLVKDRSNRADTVYDSLKNLVGNGVEVREPIIQTQNLQQLRTTYGRGSRKGGRGGIYRVGSGGLYN